MLNTIKTNNKEKKRVGRGGKRGKTSGRGHKGQGQHSSHSPRPEIRDLIKKLPKLRGHGANRSRTVNSGKKKTYPVNLGKINNAFSEGETVTIEALVERKLIRKSNARKGKIKILAYGEFNKKLSFSKNLLFSSSAEEKIKQSGGNIV